MTSAAAYSMELEHAIAYSGRVPNGAHLLPSGREYLSITGSSLAICDLLDPHSQSFLRGHRTPISCLAVSESGRLAASGESGGDAPDVVVWLLEEGDGKGSDGSTRTRGREIFRLQDHYSGVRDVHFTHCERFLVTLGDGNDRNMIVWDMETGMIVAQARMTEATEMVRWGGRERDRKGRNTTNFVLVSSGPREGLLHWLLNPETGEMHSERLVSGAHKRRYTSLAFSFDHKYLFAGSESGDVGVFQIKRKKLLTVFEVCTNGVSAVVTSEDDEIYVGGGDGTVTLFVLDGRKYVEMQRAAVDGACRSVSVSRDGRELLLGTRHGMLYRMSTSKFKPVLLSESHGAPIVDVAFPPGVSDRFATCSRDGEVIVWDSADYTVQSRGRCPSAPLCALFSPDVVLVGCEDGSVQAFDPERGAAPLWQIENANKDGVHAFCMSSNSKFLVTGGEHGDVRVWDLRSRELVTTLKEHLQTVNSLALFEDNCHVLSASRDRTFLCWDLQHEKRLSSHRQKSGAIHAIVLSADQSTVITSSQVHDITFWDLRKSEPLRIINEAHDGEVTTLAVASHGKLLASGGSDRRVSLWDMSTGAAVASGAVHSDVVMSVSFSADDNQLVSVGADGAIMVWNIYDLTG